jgi:hypothetical protein
VIGVVGILHQTDEQLELYALGRLPEPSVAEVEEHLLVCAVCQDRVDDLEAYAFAMRRAISTEPVESPSRWLIWLQQSWMKMPVLAGAGGLAAILLAGTLYWQSAPALPPLATLQLTAMRGAMPSVVPSRETDITLADAPSGTALRAKIVDSAGSSLWSGALGQPTRRIALAQRLAPGNYFVRLFDDSGKLLHEYGFQVRGSL